MIGKPPNELRFLLAPKSTRLRTNFVCNQSSERSYRKWLELRVNRRWATETNSNHSLKCYGNIVIFNLNYKKLKSTHSKCLEILTNFEWLEIGAQHLARLARVFFPSTSSCLEAIGWRMINTQTIWSATDSNSHALPPVSRNNIPVDGWEG